MLAPRIASSFRSPICGYRSPIAFLAVILACVLAGCGSSESASSTGASNNAASGSTRQSVAASSGQSSHSNGCRRVQAPIPRGAGHVPKPTLKLDPTKSYVVQLETNCGAIDIKLDVKRAPRIAASFAYLVRRGFYNGLTFHRVVAGFVIQGGDPNGNGSGGPGYTVVEPPPENLQYTRGVVAMAKATSDPSGAAGSQFFIVTGANVELPPQYALLGKVVGDESAVTAISHVPTSTGPEGEDSAPRMPVVIDKATLNVG